MSNCQISFRRKENTLSRHPTQANTAPQWYPSWVLTCSGRKVRDGCWPAITPRHTTSWGGRSLMGRSFVQQFASLHWRKLKTAKDNKGAANTRIILEPPCRARVAMEKQATLAISVALLSPCNQSQNAIVPKKGRHRYPKTPTGSNAMRLIKRTSTESAS